METGRDIRGKGERGSRDESDHRLQNLKPIFKENKKT